MSVQIYHNPRCSKSRQTLELLRSKGIEPEIIEYLKDAPSVKEIDGLLKKLNMEPRDLMRTKETEYKDNNLKEEKLTRQELIEAMHNIPKLIERPIVVVDGKKAALGRPPENVLDIL